MPPQSIIDSHIHLWPQDASDEQGHTWMTPGNPLAKPHLLTDYRLASTQQSASSSTASNSIIKGVVYIETDRRYDSPGSADLATWAKGPLDEILFLRDIVEGRYGEQDSAMLRGIVPWAPMDQPSSVLEEYLVLAKDMAGPQAWPRVKGFRLLLQGLRDQAGFEKVVLGDDFIENLKLLGRRRFSFDVGVDQRSGGTWQLEGVAKAIELAHTGVPDTEKVVFIVNHLCKPDFSDPQNDQFERWAAAVSAMAQCQRTYMKFSGAFSELPSGLKSASEIARHLKPWLRHVLKCFGPARTMFGSDWPVCNVKGPAGESSWSVWVAVMELAVDDPAYGLSDADRARIWQATATEAYALTR